MNQRSLWQNENSIYKILKTSKNVKNTPTAFDLAVENITSKPVAQRTLQEKQLVVAWLLRDYQLVREKVQGKYIPKLPRQVLDGSLSRRVFNQFLIVWKKEVHALANFYRVYEQRYLLNFPPLPQTKKR